MGPGRRGRLARLMLVACLLGAMAAGCSPAPERVAQRPQSQSHRTGELERRVELTAVRFMQLLQNGGASDQWSELAPLARAQWPSSGARAAMLAAKFAGPAAIKSFRLGAVVTGATWVSREDPSEVVQNGYSVPVSIAFADPATLRPAGVAQLYSGLRLVLVAGGKGPPLVLGEGPASLDAPLITPGQPPANRAAVPILMYHVVAPFPVRSQWNTAYAYQLEYGLTVTPGQFLSQMDFLASAGAHVISLTRLSDYLLYSLPLPTRPVVITFDDGRRSPYLNAVPILRQRGFTATFFVPTGLVGKFVTTLAKTNPQHYLSWAQVKQLADSGFWVGDHTLHDNVALWGLPPATVTTLAGETAQVLAAEAGVAVQFIAYSGVWPFPLASQRGPAEVALFAQLEQLGYVGGVVDARVDSANQSTAGIWQLARVRMTPNEPGSALAPWVG